MTGADRVIEEVNNGTVKHPENKHLAAPASLQDRSDVDPAKIDAALESLGCCSLRLLVSAACVTSCISNSISIVCASLAMPAAECELRLSSVQLGLVNGAGFVGMLIGSLLIGTVSDIAAIGRRGSLVATLTIGAVATLVSAAAPNFLVLMLLRCLVGVGTGGSFPVTLSYFAEWQPRRRRGAAVSALSSCWMLGGMLASAGAWVLLPRPLEWHLFLLGSLSFGAWRLYMALCALPFIVAALAFGFCLPDSPSCLVRSENAGQTRFLLSKTVCNGRHHGDANEDGQLEVDVAEVSSPGLAAPSSLSCAARISTLVGDLLNRQHRRSVLLLAAINSALAFSYYGLLLWFPMLFKRAHQFSGDFDSNSEEGVASVCTSPSTGNHSLVELLGGNHSTVWSACQPAIQTATKPYMEAFLVNALNLPGNLASLLLINRVGRRRLLSASLALMAATTGLIAGVWSHTQALAFSCAFAAVSAIAWNSYNVISVELLPTRLQTSAIGFCYALCRIFSLLGSVAFGALVDVGCLAPMSLSSGVLALGAVLTCALPATRSSLTSNDASAAVPISCEDLSVPACVLSSSRLPVQVMSDAVSPKTAPLRFSFSDSN